MIFRYFLLLVSLQLYRTARATHPLITLSLTIGLLFASTVILVRKVSKSMDVGMERRARSRCWLAF